MQKRIIVVEDDPSISEVLAMILRLEQYRVDSFTNATFIEGLLQDMPGLILLDLWLSGINGKDICRQLKNDERFRCIPVVIVSANRDIKLYAEESGADNYLAKPFNVSDLLSEVERFMKPID